MTGELELFRFISDLHQYAPNELKGNRDCYNPDNKREYYVGDNLDLTNCKKKEVSIVQAKIDALKARYGIRFRTGNHEAQRDSDEILIIKPGIALMHGDFIFWGKEKSDKYRRKSHGAGFLKRALWVNALEALEAGYDRKISKEDLARFLVVCRLSGVHTIIVGHLHPTHKLEIEEAGFKLIVLERGITDLWL